MAPDRSSSTEGNGATTPRSELHIIILALNQKDADRLKNRVYAITPPLWKGGKVKLHIVVSDTLSPADVFIRQAAADLGIGSAKDLGIVPYPAGDPE